MASKIFVEAQTWNGLKSAIADGTVSSHSLSFVKEGGKEGFNINGKDYYTIPSDGQGGQFLVSNSRGEAVWVDVPIEELLSYGVRGGKNIADPVLKRVGNVNYHKSLPIQSGMKGCIYNPKEKRVVYWLDEDNWNYKKGGNPAKGETENLARLDGYDGEVMVYVPEFYIKSREKGNSYEVRVSPTKIDDSWEHQPALFISAYRDTVLNEVPKDMGYLSTLPVNTAISVVNSEPYCRGGDGSDTHDTDTNIYKRNLGKSRTNIPRETFRDYARNAGKEILSYRQYKNILYWLYVIEYANFDCQADFNAEPTPEGFHQGGLGLGVTTLDYTEWRDEYNNCTLIPCGYTNDIGNNTYIKPVTIGTGETLSVPRWRGIENPFGDIWTNVDGIIINSSSVIKNGIKYSEVYTTDNPALYSDTNYQAMEKVGEEYNSEEGWIKDWVLGDTAEIIPATLGGDAKMFKCDYHYYNPDTGLRALILGGRIDSDRAGLGSFNASVPINWEAGNVGFRTVCVADK